jgi:Rap1a immunity proteins
MTKIHIVASLAVFVFPLCAFASDLPSTQLAYKTGNQLYALCSTPKSDSLQNSNLRECLGFISAVADMHNVMVSLNKSEPQFCLNPSVTVGKMRELSVQFLKDNPGFRGVWASLSVTSALAKAHPCPNGIEPK